MLTAAVTFWATALPIAGALAAIKNRSIPGWLALTLVIPPSLLVLAFLRRLERPSWLWRSVIGDL